MANKRNRNVTIYDVAEAAKVSVATVSRALNNSGYVSEKTRALIMNKVEELNFNPNQVARMLKNKNTMQIMLSMPDMRNDFYFDIISAVNAEAKHNGYSLLLNYNELILEQEFKMIDNLIDNHFDGLIIIALYVTEELINKINRTSKPIVLITVSSLLPPAYKGSYDFVGVDARTGSYLATKHLIDTGHKDIVHLGLDKMMFSGKERLRGYEMAFEDAGLPTKPENIVHGCLDADSGYTQTLDIIKRKKLPTAITTTNDVIAVGVYRALDEANIRIPEDICVVGMDDSQMCQILKPHLSSVSLCASQIGAGAAKIIFRRIEEPERDYENILFEPKLIVRESSTTSR